MDTIKPFYWQLEPSPVKVIDPIMCKHKKQKPPQQYSHIDYEAPQQHVTYYINRHCNTSWMLWYLTSWFKFLVKTKSASYHKSCTIFTWNCFQWLCHCTTYNLKPQITSVNNDKSQISIQGIIFSQKCKNYAKWYELNGKSIVQLLFCPFIIIDKYIFQR